MEQISPFKKMVAGYLNAISGAVIPYLHLAATKAASCPLDIYLICETLRCSILCVNHHLPDSSSTVFSLINGSCCRCQSTKARIHSCASSCVCTPFNKCTSSSSSCAATVYGLRVIHVSISRATYTVQRCRIASGHTSRTAFMMFGAPSHVTLSI